MALLNYTPRERNLPPKLRGKRHLYPANKRLYNIIDYIFDRIASSRLVYDIAPV